MVGWKSAFRYLVRLVAPAKRTQLHGFDRGYYLEQNADIRSAKIDPLDHFMMHGWQENRNPSKGFSVVDYLEANPDVRDAGLNPLVHFLEHGIAEGRALRRDDGSANHRASEPLIAAASAEPGSDSRVARFHRVASGSRARLV